MTLEELRILLDYHYWARDRLLEAVERLSLPEYTADLGSSFRSVRDTLVHLYSADWVWHSRWCGESPTAHLSPDLFPDLGALRYAWSTHENIVRDFLDAVDQHDIERTFEYTTFDGRPYAQTFSQMLQHLVNHGSYHRGQVTTMLRQMKAAPPQSMDLIAFHRERGAGTPPG